MQPGMRKSRRSICDSAVVIDNIEIERARRIAFARHSAVRTFYFLQCSKKASRIVLRFDMRDRINERRITRIRPRAAPIERRNGTNENVLLPELRKCCAKRVRRRACFRRQVGAERYQDHAISTGKLCTDARMS